MSQLPKPVVFAPAPLKLFQTDDPLGIELPAVLAPPPVVAPQASQQPTAEWPLERLWADYLRPIKAIGGKERNLEAIEETLRLWTEATHGPPLAQISVGLLAAWVEWLGKRPGIRRATLTSATIHKHCRTLQSLLNAAGPPRAGRPGARAILEVPYVPRPEVIYGICDEDCLTLAELARLWQAAAHMPRPTLRPAIYWRTLLLAAYYTGLRRGTLLKAEWDWLRDDEHGRWLLCPPGTVKRKKTPHWCSIPTALAAALLELRKLTGQGRHLFPWTKTRGYFDDCRRELWLRAGLGNERGHRNALHGIRKRAATELSKIDGAFFMRWAGNNDFVVMFQNCLQYRKCNCRSSLRQVASEGVAHCPRGFGILSKALGGEIAGCSIEPGINRSLF